MMKKIIEFKEGEHVDANLLVTSIVRSSANNGLPYLHITLQDDSKSIEARLWEVKPEQEALLKVGKIYTFGLEINKYRNALQAKIMSILPLLDQEINKEDYVKKSPMTTSQNRSVIHDALARIKNVNIAKLVTGMLKYYEKEFYVHPAATKIHHNFIGGLATHVSGMLKIAMAICDIYPFVNQDYLLAGVILHDLGKVEELSSGLITEYTTSGKLLGHISIGAGRLLQIGRELNLEDSEELLVLRHMILSHHGHFEYGSPVRPATLEAEMLNLIDTMDARLNTLDKALSAINEGEFTPRLFALDNRSFYKHK